MLATAKIHILKQFTTVEDVALGGGELCLLLQRYTFWSNSQLVLRAVHVSVYCACYCKDTHFEAIHNDVRHLQDGTQIVLATAKIHILKQFTTKGERAYITHTLCLLLQRYTFWSNSQRRKRDFLSSRYCACYCKDTHFEAIHNFPRNWLHLASIVLATAKIHILKQFTTSVNGACGWTTLCLLLQRYTFWSNSQHYISPFIRANYCACYCKDTHFEAIHNYRKATQPSPQLCLLLQRYTFWSNSQLHIPGSSWEIDCACYCKDTHFEAIHNALFALVPAALIVLATAKIHILKQFTTIYQGIPVYSWLCLLLQRYTFWSNSQQAIEFVNHSLHCACYCKDTHFEAIHNYNEQLVSDAIIVLATAKIHILKQFTTTLPK